MKFLRDLDENRTFKGLLLVIVALGMLYFKPLGASATLYGAGIGKVSFLLSMFCLFFGRGVLMLNIGMGLMVVALFLLLI